MHGGLAVEENAAAIAAKAAVHAILCRTEGAKKMSAQNVQWTTLNKQREGEMLNSQHSTINAQQATRRGNAQFATLNNQCSTGNEKGKCSIRNTQ
jgi:hypothetical protein